MTLKGPRYNLKAERIFMTKEKIYYQTLIEVIRTLDKKTKYAPFDPELARLRKIVDLVLNKGWDYDQKTIEYADETVKITQSFLN